MAITRSFHYKSWLNIVLIQTTIEENTRVFKAVLGITADNVEQFDLIQQAALEGDVVQKTLSPHGQEFKVDWVLPGRGEILRTLWIILPDSTDPRLTSAFIKSQ